MRMIAMGAALALVLTGAARADDLKDPVWTKAPDRADWARAYPDQAAKAGISGDVKVRCAATSAGLLENCTVISESPNGQGFGAAALSLTPGMELKPTTADGHPVTGRFVDVPVKFVPGLLQSGSIIGNPDWAKKPAAEDAQNYWPAKAGGSGGGATIKCVVTNRGLLEKCSVIAETPAGHGFGGAALAMSEMFLMKPMTVDGLPVGGADVDIPIRWAAGSTQSAAGVRVLRTAPWSATPTLDEMTAAFPKEAIGAVPAGHVILRCGLKSDGRLGDCDTVTEEPRDHGFARAARSLTRDFRVIVDPKTDHLSELKVDLPFDFRDPSAAVPPLEIYDPLWLTQVDPKKAADLFPDAAIKAGYKTGVGVVDCAVTHTGALTDCHVVKEDPPNVGFGDTALAIAGVMTMNPWTMQGSPVEGARIKLPVRLNMPDDAPPATPPAKP